MPPVAFRPERSKSLRLLVVAAAAGLGGCGSAAVAELPAPARPATSPPLAVAPTGTVVPVGRRGAGAAPAALAFDPVSGRVVVGLAAPAQLALVDGATGELGRRVALPGPPRALAVQAGDVLVASRAGLLRVRATDGRVSSGPPATSRPAAVAALGAERVAVAGGGQVAVTGAGRGVRRAGVAAEPSDVTAVPAGALAVLSGRERVVELLEAGSLARLGRADAGVGPARAVAHDRWLWVTDTRGDALLVFRTRPELQLVRRVHLPGAPYAIALDTAKLRLWVTLTRTNQVVELPAHGRPHVLRTLPTVRQPDAVAVDPSTHRVFVAGRRDAVLELIDPPPLR